MKITVHDGSFESFVSYPEAAPSSRPSIVVLQEIFGVNDDIRSTCKEWSGRGFIAVAPDLFWREAPGLNLNSWAESDWKRGLDIYRRYDLDRGIRDIAATVEAARAIDGASGKVGVTGFCLGGLLTYLAAARLPIDAAAAFYGGSTDEHLEEAANIAIPLMMHLGTEDEFISMTAQLQIQAAFARQANVEILSYPGCSHAFARHNGAHYDAGAAALATTRTSAFFKRYLS